MLIQTRHLVILAVSLRSGLDVHAVGRVDGRIFVEVIMRADEYGASVSHRHCVGDVLSMRDVEETRRYPGNQILDRQRSTKLVQILSNLDFDGTS